MSASVVRFALTVCGGAFANALGVAVALAQVASDPAKPLTGYTGPTDMPGAGKVVLAFALTLIIGAALVWGLRKALPRLATLLPQLGARAIADHAPRIVSSRTLHAGLRLHVVDVEGMTIVVAEGRAGVAVSTLPQRAPATSSEPRASGT